MVKPFLYDRKAAISVRIRENVTSTMDAASHILPAQFDLASETSEEIFERRIKGAFWSRSSPSWRARPMKKDGSPALLIKSGGLAGAVSNLSVNIRPIGERTRRTITIDIDADWPRGKTGWEYVWSHELEMGNVPQREFIQHGMRSAAPEVARMYAMPITSVRAVLAEPEMFGLVPVERKRGFLTPYLGPMAVATVLIPAATPFSQALLIWGVSADLKGAIQGQLFSPDVLRNIVMAWGLGTVGATPRVQRRRARRRLWQGVT